MEVQVNEFFVQVDDDKNHCDSYHRPKRWIFQRKRQAIDE
jgi:hypothetical protein